MHICHASIARNRPCTVSRVWHAAPLHQAFVLHAPPACKHAWKHVTVAACCGCMSRCPTCHDCIRPVPVWQQGALLIMLPRPARRCRRSRRDHRRRRRRRHYRWPYRLVRREECLDNRWRLEGPPACHPGVHVFKEIIRVTCMDRVHNDTHTNTHRQSNHLIGTRAVMGHTRRAYAVYAVRVCARVRVCVCV